MQEIISYSPEETLEIGAGIGRLAAIGDVYLLTGSLGAGKTCLTQGIAHGLGIDEPTPSPSFVLMRQFCGRLPLYHVDLYRLENLDEIADLGLDDYLYGDGVCVVEWADRGLGLLPLEHLMIHIDYIGDSRRRLSLEPSNQHYRDIVLSLGQAIG